MEHGGVKIRHDRIGFCKTLLLIWKRLQEKLAPNLSPLVSFLNHTTFNIAKEMGNFGRWINAGL